MKSILILGAGRWQLPLIGRARSLGYRVVVADADPKAVGFQLADIPVVCDIRDARSISAGIKGLKIDAVASDQTEVCLRSGSLVARRIGAVYQPLDVIECATNKFKMRSRWRMHGISIPKFARVREDSAAKRVAEDFGYPVIIKPLGSSGSQGVSLVRRNFDLPAALHYVREFSPDGWFLIEEFIEGREYTVEAFSRNGKVTVLAVSQKSKPESSYQVSTLLEYPPDFSKAEYAAMSVLVKNAVIALGITDGPSHSEVILSPRGPVMVETAARGGGFRISSEIIRLASGFDQTDALLKLSLGESFSVRRTRDHAVTLGFFYPKPGLVTAVRGLERARKLRSLFALELFVNIGDQCGELKSDRARAGYFILANKSVAQVRSDTRAIYRFVRIHTEIR